MEYYYLGNVSKPGEITGIEFKELRESVKSGILSGKDYNSTINEIRAGNKDLKKQLPQLFFNKFNGYKDKEHFEYSELFLFDADNVSDIPNLSMRLKQDPRIFFLFRSCSNNGLKFGIKLSEKITDINQYEANYKKCLAELEAKFNIKLDPTTSPTFGTYLSKDECFYTNWQSEPYKITIIKPGSIKNQSKEESINRQGELDLIIENGSNEGSRNNDLIRLIGHFIGLNTPKKVTTQFLRMWNEKNAPPLKDKEIVKAVDNGYLKWHKESKGKLETVPETPGEFASMFQLQYKDNLRYCHTAKKWKIFNGKFWEIDSKGEVYNKLRKLILSINSYVENAKLAPEERKKFYSLLNRYDAPDWKRSVLTEAESLPGIATNETDYDNNPHLYNLSNGTINLETLEFEEEHRPGDLLTKISNVNYDEDAKPPIKWFEFLETIFNGDIDLIRYVAKCVGYSLTTSTDENCFFFMYGTGKNGKSTFIEALEMVFGDYCLKASASVIMKKRNEGIPNDIARLKGSRFVSCSEIGEGKSLNEELIKDLTGGDKITARYLHQEYFEFRPEFKLWIYGNHKPTITGTDEGIKRRVKLIPFEVQIPESKRRPKAEIMEELEAEKSGILNWCVNGFLLWKKEGLKDCVKVDEATDKYFEEQDIVKAFINECCELHPEKSGKQTKCSELYSLFEQNQEGNRERVISNKIFTQRLQALGINKIRTNTNNYWKNITVRSEMRQEITGINEFNFQNEGN